MNKQLERFVDLPDSVQHLLPRGNKQTYAIAIRMRLNGHTNKEIAEVVGCEPNTVAHWFTRGGLLAKPYERLSEQTLSILLDRDSIQKRILSEVPRSIEVVCNVRDNPSEKGSARVAAGFGIMDRAGFGPVQKNVQLSAYAELTSEQITEQLGALLDQVECRIERENIPHVTNTAITRTKPAEANS